jgi:hypothetical protein
LIDRVLDWGLGVEMIRTFWFAAFCLAGLGGLLATRVTASMAFPGESILDPAVLGEALAQETLTNQALAIDLPTRDTLTKADRLDFAYLPSAAAIIAEAQAERIAFAKTQVGNAKPQPSAASQVGRTIVMLPRPRPKVRFAKVGLGKSSHPKPVVEVKTCTPPEGLSGLLMALANQPRCG